MSGDIPDQQPLNRAQRRFLGLVLPIGLAIYKQDFIPVEDVFVSAIPLKMLGQQHQGAGRLRGGVLLGYQQDATLQIDVVLPSSCTPQHPFDLQPDYVLGALDAALQVSPFPLDWVGNWVMPADGRHPEPSWVEEMWHAARGQALVSASQVLLTVGMAEDRLEVEAWGEREGQPYRFPLRKHVL
ncbi:hypothetical protein [Deinococcus sp.]|uniref:hypothetical protein n=1 Tax=Deinococcus sp. TaxID=47478 RepID=UPI0025BAC4D0|nr:hypothetical protein [Deinococcus sp.]